MGKSVDSRFTIRNLGHHDYDDVRRIALENWEGEDYLPFAFFRWLEDPGILIGIEESVSHQIIGLGHVALLPDSTAWLEGLRVRSDFRNQGLSRVIMKHQMDYALDLLKKGDITRIASSTHIKNEISIHLSLSSGFKLYGSYLILAWNPNGDLEDSIEVQPWKPTWEEIRSLPYFQETNQQVIRFFLMEQLNENWWNKTKGELDFYKVNGFRGWLDDGIEPHCVVLDPSSSGIINWLQFASFRLGRDANTIIFPNHSILEELKRTQIITWTEFTPDCLYFVYDP
jgi:RimJ/RimL family protein N-acetyltransferase